VNKRRVAAAGISVAALVTLAWPGPASAGSTLGGYTAVATATVIHLEVFEPVIPIPATPEGDFSIGYTASTVDSGPSSRALASYLWPGPVIGDGFEQLTGKPGSVYPVQVDSRYPATPSAPAKNTIQLTDGNGMTTSTDGNTTDADVTGLGIKNGGTNLLGGLGTGLSGLGQAPKSSSTSGTTAATVTPPVALPVPSGLADLVTASNLTSHSRTKVGNSSVTSTATAAASDVNILGGLLGLTGIKVTSTVTSDGTKSTSTGSATIGGIKILGVPLALGSAGISVGSSGFTLPAIPAALTNLLSQFGVSFKVSPVVKSISGPSASFAAQALVISIDTGPLKAALNGPLGALVNLLGSQAATQLAPLIQLKPKLVIELGDISTTASASPAYNGGGTPGGSTGGTTGGTTGGSTGGVPIGSGGTVPGVVIPPGTQPPGTVVNSTPPSTITPAALNLPPLGAIPRFLIFGGLILAAALGWVMWSAGGLLLGGSSTCQLGLRTGVPDLRKG
jgi:hypothetical protein